LIARARRGILEIMRTLGLYYSQLDWHHPGLFPLGNTIPPRAAGEVDQVIVLTLSARYNR
jgi:hypothetical protein